MRSTLIAFSHVLIMHLLMGSKNTASFLNRFLRPGTHPLLGKHRVSKQVPPFPVSQAFLFPPVLPAPEPFLTKCPLCPLPHTVLPGPKNPASHSPFLRNHPVLIAPLFSS